MSRGVRKFALTVHLTCSIGWIGAVVAYLALGIAAVTSADDQTVRAAWTAMDVTGWWVIVPLALAALLTGLVMSLGTHWGLFRHYWVLISLALTILCTVVLVLHVPTVSAMARLARHLEGADLRALGGDLFHPGAGLLLLLVITVLNIYKPAGVTPYGWRTQRQTLQRGAATARVSSFVFHFTEMWVAMMLGMMVFMPVRLVLVAQGATALLDASSIEFQIGMGVFMAAPMAVWMRARGCRWRQGAEMAAGMLLPVAAILMLRGLGLSATLPWLADANEHAAMLLGMLVVMLYRREHYTSGYSLPLWPVATARRSSGAHLADVPRATKT